MEKNVIVVDEQGNEYGATYPKRAKGLVKKGRARFVDDNTICLACPPNEYLEDMKMSENTKEKAITVDKSGCEINEKYIFEEIKAIREQTAYLNDTIKAISVIEVDELACPGSDKKVNACVEIVKCRETTNQQLLKFYEKAYDDLASKERNERAEKIRLIKELQFSVLKEMRSLLDEDDLSAVASNVRSQVNLWCQDILDGKI